MVIGVDAGGSYTRAVLLDSTGRVLAVGRAGAANYRSGNFQQAAAAIQAVVNEVLGYGSAEAIFIASAALEGPGSEAEARTLLGSYATNRVYLDTDTLAAWAGACKLEPGIVVVSGTGSMALGVDRTGQRYRVGGWGAYFGDEGSAYTIANQAIRQALQSLDGRDSDSELLGALLDFAKLDHLTTRNNQHSTAVVEFLYNQAPPNIAGFSLRVAELAASGHSFARSLLEEAGKDLAKLALAIELPEPQVLVSFGGSVLLNNDLVQKSFHERLQHSPYQFSPPAYPPVIGAALLARQKLDPELPVTALEHLAEASADPRLA